MANTARGFFEPFNRAFLSFQGKAIRDTYGYVASAYKQTPTIYTASTTFTDVGGLAIELAPGAHRITYILLLPATTAAGGLKLQLVANNGMGVTSLGLSAYFLLTGVTPVVAQITALSSAVNGGTATAWTSCLVTGTMLVSGAGVLTLQAAQQAASGATTIGVGSCVDTQQLTLA